MEPSWNFINILFCRQYLKMVTIIKSPTQRCHQHHCYPKFSQLSRNVFKLWSSKVTYKRQSEFKHDHLPSIFSWIHENYLSWKQLCLINRSNHFKNVSITIVKENKNAMFGLENSVVDSLMIRSEKSFWSFQLVNWGEWTWWTMVHSLWSMGC